MNITLAKDIQRMLRRKVESGQFPDEQAVVDAALRRFLVEEPDNGQAPGSAAAGPLQSQDDDTPHWRGVFAVELPEEVLFTKQIDVRPEQLDEWRPRGVTSERQLRDEDG
jgi:Arc/MetJ-type ribon-helix-helix transcriptional regulator